MPRANDPGFSRGPKRARSLRPAQTSVRTDLYDQVQRVRSRAGSQRLAMASCLVGVAVVIAIDYVTGRTSLATAYVIFVVSGAALVGVKGGLILAAICAFAWEGVDVLLLTDRGADWIDVWNAIARFAVLAVVAYLVARIVDLLEQSRATEQRSRDFLASAAHQLRTPAAALQSSSEALMMHPVDDDSAKVLANIASDTRRIGRVVGSLLRLARLDQGETTAPAWVDPVSVCAEGAQRARVRNDVSVNIDVSDTVPQRVFVPPDALDDPITNLIENAVRHARTRVDVALNYESDTLRIDVVDNGSAVPPTETDRIFDRFVTLDGRGGSGLGLPIAREAARRAGGDVIYTGWGFRLTLPAAPTRDQRRRGGKRHDTVGTSVQQPLRSSDS